MRELSKFFRNYCHDHHQKKWAKLPPHIEGWLNKTVSSSTGYSPSELMFGDRNPSILDKMLPELKQDTSDIEDLDTKLERTFSRIKREAAGRERRRKKGNTSWNPKLEDRVLIKGQNQSDTTKSVTNLCTCQGPYIFNKILPHSAYEIVDNRGKLRGEFNKRQLKPYRTQNDSKSNHT
jgi:hypothetical protein